MASGVSSPTHSTSLSNPDPLPNPRCSTGYALAVFIPMAFVCVFPVEIMRWVVVGVATLTSGIFILSSFRVAVVEAAGAKSVPLFLVMAALHAGLGLALKLYFFRYASV